MGPIDDLLRAYVFAVQLIENEVADEAPRIVREDDQFGFAFRFNVAQTDHPFQLCLDSGELEATFVLIGFHANEISLVSTIIDSHAFTIEDPDQGARHHAYV